MRKNIDRIKKVLIKTVLNKFRVADIKVRKSVCPKVSIHFSLDAGYIALSTAAFIQWFLYKNNKSFSFETVMSHRSKITELKKRTKKWL